MTSNTTQPLVIKNWQEAIADSPLLGFGHVRNANIDAYPGAIASQGIPTSLILSLTSRTFTANAGTDVCTASGSLSSQNFTGKAVTFSSTGTLPAGLVAGTVYFLIYSSSTLFKVATTLQNANAGTAIDITDAGTGTHTIAEVAVGTVRSSCTDPRTGIRFFQDSNGRVWYDTGTRVYLLNGNTLTNSAGKGLVPFRTSDGTDTYLFAFRNAAIDVVKVTSTANLEAPSWSNSWQTLNTTAGSSNSHYAIVGQDNIIYFCDTRYVGSIKENSGSVFDPATGGTYTYNNQALDMPQDEVNEWLEELGTNLLIAGVTYNKIYPWDRISDSYNLPLNVPEIGIYRLKNIGNVVYILAGTRGNIYTTQGTYVRAFKSIPKYVSNNSITSLVQVTWGGIWSKSGSLMFGASMTQSGNSGVYLLTPDGRLTQDNIPSVGSQLVTTLIGNGEAYYMGSAGAIDYIDTSNLYTSYETVIQSKIYLVGDKTHKASYSEIQVQTLTPASTGHIRIKYRTNENGTFADFPGGAVAFTADGTSTSFDADIGLIDIENIQIQIEMDGNFILAEVTLKP
jgi:hypothetical protein